MCNTDRTPAGQLCLRVRGSFQHGDNCPRCEKLCQRVNICTAGALLVLSGAGWSPAWRFSHITDVTEAGSCPHSVSTRHIGNIDSLPLLKWKERGSGFHLSSISNKLQKRFGHFARVKDSRGQILTQEPQLEATQEFRRVGVKCRNRCWIKSEVLWGCPGLRSCWRCYSLEMLIKPLLPWLWWRRFPQQLHLLLIIAHVSRSCPKRLVRLLHFPFPLKSI